LQAELLNTILFDAKNDEFPLDTVDAIYANAVFVHFTPEEIVEFLKKVKFHLQNEKIIFISVIQGRGTERTGRSRGFDRDFQYYDKSTLTEIIGQAGYIILWDNFTDEKWIQIIATVA
jgi:cyclopropane fatty-acyl-phospholipid synthase-like methyltransferase